MAEAPVKETRRVVLTGAEPQLLVADVDASCAYFVKTLGFAVAFVCGAPPFYGQVVRDGARMNLRCVAAPAIDPQVRDHEQLLSASLTVATTDDIDRLYREFQSTGATFAQVLLEQSWGAKNFIVQDIDGNLLQFAGPAK